MRVCSCFPLAFFFLLEYDGVVNHCNSIYFDYSISRELSKLFVTQSSPP